MLAQLRSGLSNAEIAARLGVSLDAVKYHVSNMLGKLEVGSREELAAWREPAAGRRVWSALAVLGWRSVVAGGSVAVVAVAGLAVLAALRDRESPEDSPPSPASSATDSPSSVARGEFTVLGRPAVPRSLHGTAVLPDGSVLFLGGNAATQTSAQPLTTSVERYDPATGTFEEVGHLLEARQTFEAVTLADGRVLVAGGVGLYGVLASAEVFNPATGVSAAVGNLSAPRAAFSAALLPDGRVLLAGGGPRATTTTDLFDPATGTFRPGPETNLPRSQPRALTLRNGDILLVSDGSAERFDAATGTFTLVSRANLPEVPALLRDGRVLLTGGYDVDEEQATPDVPGSLEGDIRPATTRAVILDPTTGEVTPTGAMNESRLLHEAVTLADGRVLVTGGAQTTHFDGDHRASAEVYDPATGRFELTGPASRGRVWFSLVQLRDGSVLVAGQNGEPGTFAEVWWP